MRMLALFILAAGFVVAVILPNEIGTHELPAVNASVLAKAGKTSGPSAALANALRAMPPDEIAFIDCGQFSPLSNGPSCVNELLSRPLRI